MVWVLQLQNNEVSALGLNAVEGYHAGSVRQQLIQNRLVSVPGLGGMTVEVFALVSSVPAYRRWRPSCASAAKYQERPWCAELGSYSGSVPSS